jgi:hypothetical protein
MISSKENNSRYITLNIKDVYPSLDIQVACKYEL